MPTELTREDVKAIYEYGIAMSRAGNLPYAAQLLEMAALSGQPFYTAFALSELAQLYRRLGSDNLELAILKRITQLPEEQRNLLEPKWMAACHEKTGDLKAARSMLAAVMKLTPDDPAAFGALAEVSLLDGRLEEADALAGRLMQRGEPPYQVLGRMIRAFSLALRDRSEESAAELNWVGQYLISAGPISGEAWDYRDIQALLSKMGTNARTATLLINVLVNRTAFQGFAQAWAEIKGPLSPEPRPGGKDAACG